MTLRRLAIRAGIGIITEINRQPTVEDVDFNTATGLLMGGVLFSRISVNSGCITHLCKMRYHLQVMQFKNFE